MPLNVCTRRAAHLLLKVAELANGCDDEHVAGDRADDHEDHRGGKDERLRAVPRERGDQRAHKRSRVARRLLGRGGHVREQVNSGQWRCEGVGGRRGDERCGRQLAERVMERGRHRWNGEGGWRRNH